MSNLPPRRKAGSKLSGLFVAARTMTALPPVFSNARSSMQVSSWATIRFSISRCALSLFGVMASISSIKTRQGAIFFASSKWSLSAFSDSPDIPDTIEGADNAIKETPSSAANALAIIVFPQPGGPWRRIPRGG